MSHQTLHLLAGFGGLVKGGSDGLFAVLQRFQDHRPAPFHQDESQDAERNEHPDKGTETWVNQRVVHYLIV